MKKTVHFYFDYISPYAYFAWLQLKELHLQGQLELELHPVVFGKLLDHWGQLGPAEIPMKRRVTFEFANRYARLHGIPLVGPPFHPYNPLPSLRLSLKELGEEEQFQRVDAIFRATWSEGMDPSCVESLEKVLQQKGLKSYAQEIQEPRIKLLLGEETQKAIELGVFGVPTMLVDDEFFWGNDQVDYLVRYLQGQDTLNKQEAKEALARERAIDRKKTTQTKEKK